MEMCLIYGISHFTVGRVDVADLALVVVGAFESVTLG